MDRRRARELLRLRRPRPLERSRLRLRRLSWSTERERDRDRRAFLWATVRWARDALVARLLSEAYSSEWLSLPGPPLGEPYLCRNSRCLRNECGTSVWLNTVWRGKVSNFENNRRLSFTFDASVMPSLAFRRRALAAAVFGAPFSQFRPIYPLYLCVVNANLMGDFCHLCALDG